MKKLKVTGLITVFLMLLNACSSTGKRSFNFSNSNTLSRNRVNFYSKYKKDNLPISNKIEYLDVVNDSIYPEIPFKKYSEEEFLSFYKNTLTEGYGDNSKYWRWKFFIKNDDLSTLVNSRLVSISNRKPKDVLTYSNKNWVKKPIPSNPIGKIEHIRIAQRGPSGQAIKVIIEGTNGTYLVAKEGNIRNLLGPSQNIVRNTVNVYSTTGNSNNYNINPLLRNPHNIPSAFIAIETIGDIHNIYGGGFGHGSGMPQWTAMDLAINHGFKYDKILKRYYKGIELKNIKSVKNANQKLRVGIMTSGFGSVDHKKVTMLASGGIKIKSRGKNVSIKPNIKVDFVAKDGYIHVISGGKTKLKTKHNLSISSKSMIGLTNIRRNIRKYDAPTYRGDFEIKLAKGNQNINLINVIDLEKYLLQVVPSEMPESFGVEALKAQAVAARTYAVKDILKYRYEDLGFHILDSTQSQVYNNLDENPTSEEAINATKGIIAVYDGKPIDAKYYSTSSGVNEAAHNVW